MDNFCNTSIHLKQGCTLPNWIKSIEAVCFGEAWNSIDEDEHIWGISPFCFSRWRISPAIQEAELLRIGVDINSRRSGYGRFILRHSQNEVVQIGIKDLFLEARISNIAARTLYESEGWIPLHIRKAYYNDGEDALTYYLQKLI